MCVYLYMEPETLPTISILSSKMMTKNQPQKPPILWQIVRFAGSHLEARNNWKSFSSQDYFDQAGVRILNTFDPWNTPENQWLEDVWLVLKGSPFLGDIRSFSGV